MLLAFAVMVALLLLTNTVVAVPVVTTYEFVTDQSIVSKTGGLLGQHYEYPVWGQFQLTVDLEAETAWFDTVDAYYSDSWSLDDRFSMTELPSTTVTFEEINFLLEKHIPMFPGADIHMTVFLDDGSLQIVGNTSDAYFDGYTYILDGVAVEVPEPSTISFVLLVIPLILRGRKRFLRSV